MKLHFRDKLAALAGAVVLAVLVLVSYYYALMGQIGNLKTKAPSDVPDFIARDIALTEFDGDGTAERQRMETDAFVRLESGTDVTSGRGMTFDNVERTVDILSDVRTIVLPKAAETQEIAP